MTRFSVMVWSGCDDATLLHRFTTLSDTMWEVRELVLSMPIDPRCIVSVTWDHENLEFIERDHVTVPRFKQIINKTGKLVRSVIWEALTRSQDTTGRAYSIATCSSAPCRPRR